MGERFAAVVGFGFPVCDGAYGGIDGHRRGGVGELGGVDYEYILPLLLFMCDFGYVRKPGIPSWGRA